MDAGGIPALTVISLPWPPKELSPNARRRIHWRKAGPIAKQYRRACWALTLQSQAVGKLLSVTFNPPDRRRRDDDGMIGAFKAGRDGIADALRCDDHTFRPDYRFGNVHPGGRIVVEIGEVSDGA